MNTKERIELKRKLREIAKSESPMNMNTCDYFKQIFDEVTTRTGFRKTRFGEGKIWLNDRVIQMKGYAQRTSNE
jgi:hypothetical protein